MKKKFEIVLVVSLILSSIALYLLHYAIFHDSHHIFIFMVGEIAFMPIEVLIVTLILHRLLQIREKRKMMMKLNMVIGAFFSEAGEELLRSLSDFDKNINTIRDELISDHSWSKKGVAHLNGIIMTYKPDIDSRNCNLNEIKSFLLERRSFLLRLIENQNLLENESFSDLLWAVSHLQEELFFREDFTKLPESDLAHLSVDIKRAYKAILGEWVNHMKHLNDNYPYLFSLAKRTNPFDTNASVIVK